MTIVGSPKRKGRQQKTIITISSPEEKDSSLFGSESVKNAIMESAEEKLLRTGILSGWVTINKCPKTRYAKEWFYCGGDIHETREQAMKIPAANRVAVVYIEAQICK